VGFKIDSSDFMNFGGDDAEFVPIIADAIEEESDLSEVPEHLPILPLRNTVLFPGVVIPITVGREKSIKLVREIYKSKKMIGVLAQNDNDIDEPGADDLHRVGTMAQIIKILQMPDDTTSVIIQGKRRFQLEELVSEDPYMQGRVTGLTDAKPLEETDEFEAIVGSIKDLALKIIKSSSNIPQEASFALKNIEGAGFLINYIGSNIDIGLKEKQELLEMDDLKSRSIRLLEYLSMEHQKQKLKFDIQEKVKHDLDQQQREFLLNQQMKTIQDELGGNPMEKDIKELKERAKNKKWNKEVAEIFDKELDKLARLNPAAGEFSIQLTYVQTLLDLPWNEFSDDNFDLKHLK
jgi:ATP-dependent Lon protease